MAAACEYPDPTTRTGQRRWLRMQDTTRLTPPPTTTTGNLLHAGDPAPEIEGLLLDTNDRVTLAHIWRKRTVVIEFGSFT